MTITKLEDSENHRNAFEISGDRHRLCGCSLFGRRGSGPADSPRASWRCCGPPRVRALCRPFRPCAPYPHPPHQPASVSSREHDRADLGVLQQPAGPPRVGGSPAEADEGHVGGEPHRQAPLRAVPHRKGPCPAPDCRPQVRRARPGPGVFSQMCPHRPWTMIASQGTPL